MINSAGPSRAAVSAKESSGAVGRGRHSGDRRLPPIGGKHGRVVEDFAFVVLDPKGDDRHEVGVVDAFDQLQCAELLAALAAAQANNFHRRLGPARRGGLPHLAKAAAAQKLGQPVAGAGDGLIADDVASRHEATPEEIRITNDECRNKSQMANVEGFKWAGRCRSSSRPSIILQRIVPFSPESRSRFARIDRPNVIDPGGVQEISRGSRARTPVVQAIQRVGPGGVAAAQLTLPGSMIVFRDLLPGKCCAIRG